MLIPYDVLHIIVSLIFAGVRSRLLRRGRKTKNKSKSKSKSNRSTEFSDVDLGSDQESDTGRMKERRFGPGIDKISAFDHKKPGTVMKRNTNKKLNFMCNHEEKRMREGDKRYHLVNLYCQKLCSM